MFVQGQGRSRQAGSSGGGDAAGAPVSQEQLHPSWAAKRKQTLSITAVVPAGKKIKFDEEGGEGHAAAGAAAAAAPGAVGGAKVQAVAAKGVGKRGFAGGPGRKDGVGQVASRGPAPRAVRPGGMKVGGRGAAVQAAGGGRGSGAPTSGSKATGTKVRGPQSCGLQGLTLVPRKCCPAVCRKLRLTPAVCMGAGQGLDQGSERGRL